jgi:hypothetical protein
MSACHPRKGDTKPGYWRQLAPIVVQAVVRIASSGLIWWISREARL